METFFLFVVLILLIVLLTKITSLENKSNEISKNLQKLFTQHGEIKEKSKRTESPESYMPSASKDATVETQKPPQTPVKEVPVIKPAPPPIPSAVPPVIPVPEKPKPIPVATTPKPPIPQHSPLTPVNTNKPLIPKKPPINLEKFIGENLINKIGIGILVIGIGFFVKFAIDQNWINEFGRVAIGVICGAILIGMAHRMRNTYTAFSSVLIGGGMASLYLTFTMAFQLYHIIPQTPTFIIMIGITAFTVLLSIFYDRKELAVLGILGGFGSPFMVSTGQGDYVVLFIYIIVLNCGMLSLAYYKKWNLVNIISYIFTIILFGSWLLTKFREIENPPYIGALIFASAFYIIFFLMNIINNLKESRKFEGIDIAILLSNTALYFSAGMYILSNINNGEFQGLFTVSLGIFNTLFAYSLYKKANVDRTLVFLLIGLVLTFASLAAPIQLEGNYITLFWASESVLLLWLSQKSGIKLMRYTSLILLVLTLISLAGDWNHLYLRPQNDIPLDVLLNKGFITGLISTIAVFFANKLVEKEPLNDYFAKAFELENGVYRYILTLIFIGLSYMVMELELNYQLNRFMTYNSRFSSALVIGVYNMTWVYALSLLAEKRKNFLYGRQMASILGGLMLLLYLVYYQRVIKNVRNEYLMNHTPDFGIYLLHYAMVTLLVIIVIRAYRYIIKNESAEKELKTTMSLITVLSFLFILSAELDNFVVMSLYEDVGYHLDYIVSQNHKIGWPILWGLSSFVLMFIGMKKKLKDLRFLSLGLFLVTLLKLFIFDIRGISEGGKIAAFISLGVLLLIISFMYQKLKKLIWDDEPTSTTENK